MGYAMEMNMYFVYVISVLCSGYEESTGLYTIHHFSNNMPSLDNMDIMLTSVMLIRQTHTTIPQHVINTTRVRSVTPVVHLCS